MEECTDEAVQQMLPLVSAQRREQALRYKHTLGRFCCLKSWLMLYELLDEGMRGLMDKWEYNEHGKPSFHLSPLTSHLYFSISHCKEGIAVAVDETPIGVDIEAIRHVDNDLIERVMLSREREEINKASEPDRAFTRLWTQKEAVVKAQGTGITSFEQLQYLLLPALDPDSTRPHILQTFEKEKYIYSIAYGKLHCFSAEIPAADL